MLIDPACTPNNRVISENRVQWTIAYLAAVTFNFVVVPIDL